jgi:hypothetical protein
MRELKGIYVEGTIKTPKIEFTHLTGELILDGRSIPENAAKVYEPLLVWINEYVKSPCYTTNLHLKLEYFNSASLVWITKMIIGLCNIKLDGAVLYVHMYFEIDDFEDDITEELRTIIDVLADRIRNLEFNVAFKTHGIDRNGDVVKESTILI